MHWSAPRAALAVGVVSIFIAACTSVDTSVVGPSAGPKCQVSVGGTPASFGPGGGTGTMNIATTRDCTWSITAVPAWISINGDRGGQGEAAVGFTVAANPVPVARSGALGVGTEVVQISQEAAPCRFSLNRGEDSIAAAGGSLTVQLDTLTGCNWLATSDVPWVGISSGQSGSASGAVVLQVAANSGAARTGTVRIAGQLFTVKQTAGGGTGSPAPNPVPVPPPPPQGTVQVEGNTHDVKGHCPNLTFTVSGRRIETSNATTFSGMPCSDLEKKDRHVRVVGTERLSGTIDATRVTKID
jgi:BACON domain-containing protein/all-beta uncharacterized protein